MSITQLVTPERRERILHESTREGRRVVITHHADDGWRMYKGTFAVSREQERSLCVEVATEPVTRLADGLEIGDVVGCAFRDGHRKCIFTSVVEHVHANGSGTLVALRNPDQIQQLQRRAFERAAPPANNVIAVRFWRETGTASPDPADRDMRHGQLIDISAGGMRVRAANTQRLDLNLVYRCAFTPKTGKPAFVLDALLRHREAEENGRAALGFQFIGLETTSEGRRTLDRLARLVSQYQRTRNRRDKTGE